MSQKLNCALIVDEDRAANFFNKMVINRHESFDQVVSVQNTEAALSYLESIESREGVNPDAIFIDYAISCSKRSDFFAKFNDLNNSITNGIKIFVMAPHSDQKIIDKIVDKYPIDELITVPLSFPLLNSVLDKHFFIIEHHDREIVNFNRS